VVTPSFIDLFHRGVEDMFATTSHQSMRTGRRTSEGWVRVDRRHRADDERRHIRDSLATR
jgi:hypothetical protein